MGAVRHQDRYLQISRVLYRHGLGYFVHALGLERWVRPERVAAARAPSGEPHSVAVHVRLVLEELGPTAVKLGQILSTRPDLLSPAFQQELEKLQDRASPVPLEVVRAAVREELGADPEKVFLRFDPVPLASASIGQAHTATLADGSEVVVKVRRPGVVEEVEADLEILRALAARAAQRWSAAADYDLVGLTTDFADTLRAELDYLQEAQNAERFARNFRGDPDIHVPEVHWDTTTSRVITLERLRGTKISDLRALDEAGVDRSALAARATRLMADMVFEHGFFHADPHPGNFLIEPSGRIGLLDYGMVGEVDERTRRHLAALLAAFERRDPARIAAAFADIGITKQRVDRGRLTADAAYLLSRYEGLPLGKVRIGDIVRDVLEILRRHHLALPRNLALVVKMIVMTEGLGSTLDPDFQIGSVLSPYARRLVLGHVDPVAIARRLRQAGLDAAALGVELPGQLGRLLDVLDRDGVSVSVRTDDLDPLVARVERIGNRLVVAMVTAAGIEALALLASADPDRLKPHETKVAALGAAAVGSLTAYLGWTARGRRRRR
ncbi:AarF/ABC1/UbiB kinase family protein [Kineococcus sp. TRM81007]|uniref:ABC1 kinase family protein n=1 Tax=Kineococcus sp. TRM81007 TaxID=2925831 RepID=UPI001F58005E|nr:AarF/ABC1/UbiB kinase family protein [Kineococcus sp. TRM81007]MCI2238274.1 AarF/ABC1/UbiB kinase family protein [Kineococcus sp. TRM81007]